MRNLIATLLAVLMVLGGVPLAITMYDDPDATGPDEASTSTQEAAEDGTAARASGTTDDASAAASGDTDAASLSPAPALLRPPKAGATPLEMTANLLGPVPEDLRRVDPSLPLTEAMRRHPAFEDGTPQTPGLEGPVASALSRLIQAHGLLTELQTAAGQGDPVAQDLMPYAAAQMATEAQRAAPVFDTASTMRSLDEKSDLRLHGEAVPASEVGTLQEEVDRLYTNMGLPHVPASAGTQDPTKLARIVHATADVVEATKQARQMSTVAAGVEEDLRRVDLALEDGQLTPEEAKMVAEVATMVHEVTTAPLQARLDALDTLHATVETIAPTLTMTTGHDPVHNATDPYDETVNQTRESVENGTDDAVNQTRDTVNGTLDQANGTIADARALANQTIEPVEEALADNFVDPFGAIVILGEDDDEVNRSGTPVPVNVPGVGPVGSLFPRSPILVVDRGGDEVYTGLPSTRALDETVDGTEEPLVSEDELPVQGDTIIENVIPRGGPTGPFADFLRFFATEFVYRSTFDTVEEQVRFQVAVKADTPAQVVVDLSGNDRYEGETGAAYAAGGGTAAVFDRQGDDTYEVDKGIGLLQEDGLALVKDLAGDDTYHATRGVGSVIQPFTFEDNRVVFDDDFRFRLGGLGGLVDFDGDDTYEVEELGVGFAWQASTSSALPAGYPVALDLGGESEDFVPRFHVGPIDFEPEPSAHVEKDDGGSATAWIQEDTAGTQYTSPFFLLVTAFNTVFGDGATVENDVNIRWIAANRTYDVDLAEPTEGRIEVTDHNVTLQRSFTVCPFFCLQSGPADLRLHNHILMDLSGDDNVYEPPHPLILIDGGNSTDTYINATPQFPIDNGTTGRNPETAAGVFFSSGGFGSYQGRVPLFVLDTQGNDRWTGETAHMNTSRIIRALEHEARFGAPSTGTFPTGSAVIVDAAGDDLYEGNLSSTEVNLTARPSTFATLVHDASGSDTIRGELVGGIHAAHAAHNIGFNENIAHSVVNLLLMGSEDPDEESNDVTVGSGSMGAIRVERSETIGPNEAAQIGDATKMIAGAAVAAPTTYRSGNHSFGSVDWCLPDRPCPEITNSITGANDKLQTPLIAGLFVGSNGPDTYQLDRPEGLGHVTAKGLDDNNLCEQKQPTLQAGATFDIPNIVTRFIDVGGGDRYQMGHDRAELPPWRNDHTWRPYECPNVQPAIDSGEDAQDTAEQELQDGSLGTLASIRQIDTLGIDNLGQYVLDTASTGAGETLEDEVPLIRFEPPQLCVGPYAQRENGSTLRGLDRDRCADPSEPNRFEDPSDAIETGQRIILTTRTQGTVPGNLFGAVNPCDTGQTGDRVLSLDVREENEPEGNPLAHGTSGCWATLQVRHAGDDDGRERTPGPVWAPYEPTGTGWIDVLAAPVHCGYTDENTPVRCSTDAFPLPYHVDGTNGRNQGRWLLAEGVYEYRMQFHGPMSVLLGTNSTLPENGEALLRIDRDPVASEGPVPGFEEMPTRTPEGLFRFVEAHNETLDQEAPGALAGLRVRPVSQDGDGEPEMAEVWGPINLISDRETVPVVCVEDTPYRGEPSDTEDTWRGDLGVWVTRYPLTLWDDGDSEFGDPPASCPNAAAGHELNGTGPHTVETSLWHLGAAGLERIQLPENATTDRIVVDDTDPFVDVGPLQGALGVDLDTHGVGVADLEAPDPEAQRQRAGESLDEDESPRPFTTDDLGSNQDRDGNTVIRFELPIRILDESPIEQIDVAGETDQAWEDNWIGDVGQPITLTFQNSTDPNSGETTLECLPRTTDSDSVCEARLNLTSAGEGPGQGWHRYATLNLTLHTTVPGTEEPEEPPSEHRQARQDLHAALARSIEENQQLTLELPEDLEVVDEATNDVTKNLDELLIDLSPPSDLPLPCGAEGVSLITTEETVPIQTFIGPDDVTGLYVERRVNATWIAQQWVPEEDLTRVNRYCEPDNDGQWLTFNYTADDAEAGTETLHLLRTVTLDEAGNRELSTGPFEFSILFDQRSPGLAVEQTSASPTSTTVTLTADEPVTLDQDAHVVAPDGTTRAPLGVPDEPSTQHALTFEALDVNATYTLNVTATDEAGLTNTTAAPVQTARSINVSLRERPGVVGDNVTLKWSAGALGPAEGGSPSLRVQASALADGQACGSPRTVTTFIDAPLDEPENRTLTLPLVECPGGNLTVELAISNGPEDAPLETVRLNTTVAHDVTPPDPSLKIDGEKASTGWYTSPVSLTPSGSDDTGITQARILTEQGPVKRLSIDQSGQHTIVVRATDEAGRSTTTTVDVPVDLARPQVALTSQDTLPTERSVITIQVDGEDDASGLRSIRIRQPDATFGAWTPVVEGMQMRVDIRGLDVVLAEVRDRAGHITQTVLPVTSLADPPKVLDASVEAAGPGTVEVRATLDRPVALEGTALQEGDIVAETVTEVSREQRFTLTGLTPASTAEVQVRAQLTDGRSVTLDPLSESLELPADGGPPTVPGNLTAEVLDDGTVQLAWDAADDDAGVARYLIQRRSDGAVTDQWSITRTRLLDDPSASAAHTYRVRAVDLSGQTGGWTDPVTVTPDLPLKILSYDVTPEVAPAGAPVSISVVAQGSQAPDTAYLELGDRKVPLVLKEGGQGRWLYQANLTLPTTDTFFPEGVRVHLGDQAFPAQGTFPGPVVKALEDGEVSTTSNPVPGPGLLLVAMAGVLAALRRRRWST